MRPMNALEQARSHFEVGEFVKAREAAEAGLQSASDDVELLKLAGRAGVETGSDDAVEQLRRVTELQPNSAEAWRDLADALETEGRSDEAGEAFRKVLEIEPDDEAALTALGHEAFQEGKRDDGVSILEQVASRVAGASTAAISLVEMYRTLGQPGEALAAARRVVEADPERPLATLDVAELSLEVGELDDAAEAFARLRDLLEQPEGQVAALQGAVKVELAREDLDRALELARQAGAIDSVGRTAGILAFLEAEVGAGEISREAIARGATTIFLQAQEAPPTRDEAESLIDATLADLRRELRDQTGQVEIESLG
jgi:tetratricopeptide (TPR) repeat protein